MSYQHEPIETPVDARPITPTITADIEGLLRGQTLPPLPRSIVLIIIAGGIYGGVMGSFGLVHGNQPLQILFAAIKLPFFLLATFAFTLPSLLLLNLLSGVKANVDILVRALVSQLAVFAMVLASLAPITLLWYASSGNYEGAVLFNGVIFSIGILASLSSLVRACQRTNLAQFRQRALIYLWQILFIFVAIQLAWMLRPFIGSPSRVPVFLRMPMTGNAYEEVMRLLGRVLFNRY